MNREKRFSLNLACQLRNILERFGGKEIILNRTDIESNHGSEAHRKWGQDSNQVLYSKLEKYMKWEKGFSLNLTCQLRNISEWFGGKEIILNRTDIEFNHGSKARRKWGQDSNQVLYSSCIHY
ncbi:hypothetical protein CEXT_715351 [Caerostris extrusa]|uniref:Uncharacterized protein n=1 Tax=Caerostris extrusa TaxID=172846 RepID=A0AAV4Q7D9_CAEEX|nr:hypothetical protein CEXT_715351 [Caerostris extrusa]